MTDLRNLMVVFYIDGTTQIEEVPLSQARHTVFIMDTPRGIEWTCMSDSDGRYRVGRDIRVPNAGENKEYWGPMMVYDPNNPEHVAKRNHEVAMLEAGTLVH